MIVFALGFVCGAFVLQQQAVLPPLYFACLLLPLFAAMIKLYRWRTKPALILQISGLFIFSCMLGFCYAALLAHLRLSDALPEPWEKQSIELVGVVASLPENTERGIRFRFDVEQVLTANTATLHANELNTIHLNANVPKHIALTYYPAQPMATHLADKTDSHQHVQELNNDQPMPRQRADSLFSAGERWQLTARLKRPHGTYNPHGYDFEAWALAENIRAIGTIRNKGELKKLNDFVWRPGYFIEHCREKIAQNINRILAGHAYAGVLIALVVGDGSQISREQWDVFLNTGTNHLMSISGLHITMLAGLAYGVAAFIWRRMPGLAARFPASRAATVAAILVALIYAYLAGMSVPTQRTLIMLFTFAAAILIGKKVAITRVLAIALVLVVLFDPWAVLAPGFWLSFSAVALIAYVTVNRFSLRHWLVEAVRTQWAITLGLLPFLILMFGQTSVVSPVANAIAIPLISLVVVPLAILGALLGTILPVDFILLAVHQVFSICMLGLSWLAHAPFATWQQATPPAYLVVLAVAGVLWGLLPRGFPQRWLGALLVLPMLSFSAPRLQTGEMQAAVLDVGQGLSVVIKTATHTFLYDTGPSYGSQNDAGRQIVLPYLRGEGIQHLDGMVISHNDIDHSGGASSVLSHLAVAWLASSYPLTIKQPITAIFKQWRCVAGQHWIWDQVRFEILSPDAASYRDQTVKDNNRSCVVKVTSAHGSLLLSGDIELSAEQKLINSHAETLKSDVVVVPHHGSKTSSSQAFIEAVDAQYALFTVGYLNRFNHPKPQVVQRYQNHGTVCYRSDHAGALIIDFTGKNAMNPQAWRQQQPRYWQDAY